jgi:hypothetical protein
VVIGGRYALIASESMSTDEAGRVSTDYADYTD